MSEALTTNEICNTHTELSSEATLGRPNVGNRLLLP